MRKSLTLLAASLLFSIATFAQTVLVQGQVTDDRGPVPKPQDLGKVSSVVILYPFDSFIKFAFIK